MTVHILGGGPAGLSLAYKLAESGKLRFSLLEKDGKMGGLAKTLHWEPYGWHDLGPHKIFTLDKDLLAEVLSLLPESQWLERPKNSRIFIHGKYLPYPPSPLSLINIYGKLDFLKMTVGYGLAKLRGMVSNPEVVTFEDDLNARVGSALYKALFRPMARKIWGDPRNLDAMLSQGRVQTPSIIEVLKTILGKRGKSGFEALGFMYPRGGLQKLWDSIEVKSGASGTFSNNKAVSAITIEGRRVSSISTVDTATKAEETTAIGPGDFVVSTLPLRSLPELMGGGLTQATKDAIDSTVDLNDLILVLLKVDVKSLLEDCWIFVPDPDVAFHRLSEQESFDPEMVAEGSIVCCEIMSNELKDMQDATDAELISSSLEGLHALGLEGFKVQDTRVIRIKSSYPVFRPGYADRLHSIIDELDSLENFRSIGRQGAFNYIGTLDAMDIGFGTARWLDGMDEPGAAGRWLKERERTTLYPVLD